LSEDLDGDGKPDSGSLNNAITSVQIIRNRILVGTKGCDIFEAIMPTNPTENHTLTRVACGHSSGELWGLAVNPMRDEFATCGDDKTIRIWSLRSREQLCLRVMPSIARALAYSPKGEIIALGMEVLIYANNLLSIVALF
jgi:microtubule-associated protein-like 6